MKKTIFSFSALLFLVSPLSSAQAAYHSFDQAAGLSPTEIVDKTQLQGWIVKIDYKQNNFRLMDPRGFERKVTAKFGTIGQYRIGDHVKVTVNPDWRLASQIEKI